MMACWQDAATQAWWSQDKTLYITGFQQALHHLYEPDGFKYSVQVLRPAVLQSVHLICERDYCCAYSVSLLITVESFFNY